MYYVLMEKLSHEDTGSRAVEKKTKKLVNSRINHLLAFGLFKEQ